MNIYVRVQGRAAQAQIAALEGQIKTLQRSTNGGASAVGGLTHALQPNALERYGSRLQWIGRQLEYNFTLPIAAAGIAATKFELDNERAMVGVVKVYGDGSAAFNQLTKTEIPALGRAFEVLSNEFAVNRAQVIGIAADWAQAGASGLALAKSVKLTLETMILGEMNATEATQALIAIQAQYGQTVGQLSTTIDVLNQVENQTGITMEGLIQGFARAAGVARSAGVDVRHLAAFLAALTPAAGSAANAGNALKTIFSRLMAPTKDATQVMGLMGINVKALTWQSMNGTQRLEEMAKQFETLSGAQKLVVSSTIASRFQINRFDVLMRDVINVNGYYQKALKSTADATANYRQRQYELNTVLNSNPQRLKQIWVILQNALADTIQPLLPAIVYLAGEVAKLVRWFSNLNPAVQHLAIVLLILLAAVGPVVRYFGALTTLFGAFSTIAEVAGGAVGFLFSRMFMLVRLPFNLLMTGFGGLIGMFGELLTGSLAFSRGFVATIFGGLKIIPELFVGFGTKLMFAFRTIAVNLRVLGFIIADALTGPVGWAIGIAIGIFALFHRQLGQVWHSIINLFQGGAFRPVADMFKSLVDFIERQFNRLPEGVRNAFLAVVHIVESAAMEVYKLFQYLNPFAHHSPSLVENTHKGMQHVRAQHEKTAQSASNLYTKTSGDIQTFNKATGYLNTESRQFADKRSVVQKVDPAALASFDKLIADLVKLDKLMAQQKAAVDAQQLVVDKWKASLDAANAALDEQQKKLESLQKAADLLNTALQQHQDALQTFAQTPIAGMKAMGDAIFDNDQAQKKLQLQLLQMEDVVGPIDKVQQKMANLAGDIEKLKGEQTSLRSAGAGSDITGAYDTQINQLQAQQKSITATLAPMTDLQNQLDKLSRQGQELNLEQSLQFDPLTKQINDMTNSMKELPFDQIIAGIKGEQDVIAQLQPQADAANKAVTDQQAVVDQYKDARDKVQASYDVENAKLQKLQDEYQKTADMVNQVKDALNSMSDAAQRAADKAAKGSKLGQSAQNFQAAAGGNFPDVGGSAKIGREGGLGDQSKLIDEWTKGETANLGHLFGSFDMLSPIKKKWSEFTGWFSKNVGPSLQPAVDGFKSVGDSIWTALFGSKPKVTGRYSNVLMGDLKGTTGQVTGIFDTIKKNVEPVIGWVERQVKLLGQLFGPDVRRIIEAFTGAFAYAQKKLGPELKNIKDTFHDLTQAWRIQWAILKPIIEFFAVFFILRIKMIVSVITAVLFPILRLLVDTIKNTFDVFRGILKVFVGLFTGDWSKMWEGIKLITGGFFKEIWDIFANAFRAIGDVIKAFVEGIVQFFVWLWNELTGHSIIPDMIKDIVKWFLSMPGMILDALKSLGSDLLNLATEAMTALWNGAKAVWDQVNTWLGGLPQLALDAIKGWIDLQLTLGKDAFNALWTGAKLIWEGAKGIAGWIGGLPAAAYGAIKGLIDSLGGVGKDALNALWTGAKGVWDGAKGVYGWFSSLPGAAFGLVNDIIGDFKNIGADALNGLWTAMKNVWNGAKGVWGWLSGLPDDIVGMFDGIGRKMANKFSGMFDGIIQAFKSAMNWVIDRWNDLSFKIGGWVIKVPFAPDIHVPSVSVGLPTIPRLARGGMTDGPALVGEGRRGFPEFVIPTDPQFRSNALALYRDLGRSLGLERSLLEWLGIGDQKSLPAFASGGVLGTAAARATRSGGTLGPVTVNNRTEIHFHGDLEFPNVKSGDDAEEFIRNLEAVI